MIGVDFSTGISERSRDEAITGYSLLATRLIVHRELDEGHLDCDVFTKRCLEWLSGWSGLRKGESEEDDEPAVVGGIHLFAEIHRRKNGVSCDCVNTLQACIAKSTADCAYHQLMLAFLYLVQGRPDDAVFCGPATDREGGRDQLTAWSNALTPRGGQLEGGKRSPARTEVGQALIMHVLELALSFHRKAAAPKLRGMLNLLVAPLLHALYSYPDRSHVAYARYWHGARSTIPGNPFHALYHYDLGVLEDFQSRGIARRSEILGLLRGHADTDGRPGHTDDALSRKINHVLHGTPESGEIDGDHPSPRPKMTRVSQLACLIRKIDDSPEDRHAEGGRTRTYVAQLSPVQYRKAHITDIALAPPGRYQWTLATDDLTKKFEDCVTRCYQLGHAASFLAELFRPTSDSNRTDLPVWIQDGEITFLWLLTAWITANGNGTGKAWVASEGGLGMDLWLSKADVVGRDVDNNVAQFVRLGRSFDDFAAGVASLFDKGGKALPKAWALFNFLQRTVLSTTGQLARYAGDAPLGAVARMMYTRALEAETLSREWLQHSLEQLQQEAALNSWTLDDLRGATRLPTFPLELILRTEDPIPYSLFLYPVAFKRLEEEGESFVLPTAFLAGTFGALEWDDYPTVIKRQNHHLFAVLDAIRPLIDHELGRVLSDDQDSFRKQADAEKAAVQKAAAASAQLKVAKAIVPAAAALAQAFRSAIGNIMIIDCAVNPDWAGLFGPATEACASLFGLIRIPIQDPADGEPLSLIPQHDIPLGQLHQIANSEHLASALVYLARNVLDVGIANGSIARGGKESGWKLIKLARSPFEALPFLDCIYSIGCDADVDPGQLLLLMKLLTSDTLDFSKGIHVLQLVTALGITGRTGSVTGGGVTNCSSLTFDPKKEKGVRALLGLLGLLSGQESPGLRTANMQGWYLFHSEGDGESKGMGGDDQSREMSPYQFLRSLVAIAHDVLGPKRSEEDNKVELVDWEIVLEPTRLVLTLHCIGVFTDHAKLLFVDPQALSQDGYHNFRSNIPVVARAVGSPPTFVKGDLKTFDGTSPFLVCENPRGTRTDLRFEFRARAPARQRP